MPINRQLHRKQVNCRSVDFTRHRIKKMISTIFSEMTMMMVMMMTMMMVMTMMELSKVESEVSVITEGNFYSRQRKMNTILFKPGYSVRVIIMIMIGDHDKYSISR